MKVVRSERVDRRLIYYLDPTQLRAVNIITGEPEPMSVGPDEPYALVHPSLSEEKVAELEARPFPKR